MDNFYQCVTKPMTGRFVERNIKEIMEQRPKLDTNFNRCAVEHTLNGNGSKGGLGEFKAFGCLVYSPIEQGVQKFMEQREQSKHIQANSTIIGSGFAEPNHHTPANDIQAKSVFVKHNFFANTNKFIEPNHHTPANEDAQCSIMKITEVKYDHPRLRNGTEILNDLFKQGGIEAINRYLDQPSEISLVEMDSQDFIDTIND